MYAMPLFLSLSLAFILGTLFSPYVLNLVFNQITIILLGMIYTLLNTVFSLRPPQLLHSKRDEFEKLINSFDLECLKSWWFCGGSKTSPKFAKICGESENDLFGFFLCSLSFLCLYCALNLYDIDRGTEHNKKTPQWITTSIYDNAISSHVFFCWFTYAHS